MINFPSTFGQPTDGTFKHTEAGQTWAWNGVTWKTAGGDGFVPQTGPKGAAIVPSGLTSERPGSPSLGMTRYNTQLKGTEVWDGIQWRGGMEFRNSGGWQSGAPLAIAQQYVADQVACTFTVPAITLTEGSWIVTACVYASLGPNKPAGGYVGFQITVPYGISGGNVTPNVVFTSKPDGAVFRGGGDTNGGMDTETALTIFMQCTGDVTLNSVRGLFMKPGGGTHDLKVNCWYTAVRIN